MGLPPGSPAYEGALMKRRILLILLAVLLLLVAAGIAAYPMISNYVNTKYQSIVRTNYEKQVEQTNDSEIRAALAAAKAYNDSLTPVRFSKEQVQAASLDYDSLLNLNGSGIMGYVEIPKLSINLPIYHGTGETVLEKGVGHLVGSSLPVGGADCHSVLTGHSGVAGNKLFSDIDRLSIGDVFYLRILDQTFAYEVTEINKVYPHETELLAPVAGEDLCTLLTCTPYGVNTHRLLVRGSRIPYEEAVEIEEETEKVSVKSTWKEQYYTGLLIGGGVLLAAAFISITVIMIRRRRRRRET